MKRLKPAKHINGFTLPELLVVLVIIGILVLIALPRLMPLISSARATEAQLQLDWVHTLQQKHFYMYSRYSDDLEEIGFEQEAMVDDGGTANYLVEIIDASNTGYVARATSITDFDQDGTFNVWEINEKKELKEVTRD